MLLSRFAVGILSVCLMLLGIGMSCGQGYPNKPIRIVTSEAGGGSDFAARPIAQGLSVPLSQTVIVDNRPGIIAIETVAKAPPDGYTLILYGQVIWITPLLQKTTYDVVRDFSPITMVASSPNLVVVHPSLPVTSVKELIALAKAKPGELNYGGGGAGASTHLAPELFKAMAGVNIVYVPFKGVGPALNALIAGEVQLMFSTAGSLVPHIKAGRLRALAVTSAQPSALTPGLPTVAASGVPGYESVSSLGILAPAQTPEPIINRLNQEVVRVLNQPDLKAKFLNSGIEVVASSPAQLAATMKSEMTVMGKVIKDAGIKGD
jgi:tripartite-type tricarboxylate transporter receptor subunit TctC